ncbi:MAG: preprotein translocase subunit YajC, partial [Oscillospiraceae bacterium]
ATTTAAGQVPGGKSSVLSMIISFAPLLVILVIMYFLMIRPQKKKEKEVQSMRRELQIGDEVTTVGGITGIVVRKTEDTVVLETGGDRSKIRVKLWAIQSNETIHDTPEA